MATCETVIKFDLSLNNIGTNGCTSLSNMLTYNTKLKHLRLSSCQLENDALKVIADGLKVNSSLVTLYLDDNSFSDIEYFCVILSLKGENSDKTLVPLTCLYFDKNYIDDQGCLHMAKVLKDTTNLTVLYLNNN